MGAKGQLDDLHQLIEQSGKKTITASLAIKAKRNAKNVVKLFRITQTNVSSKNLIRRYDMGALAFWFLFLTVVGCGSLLFVK